MVPRPHCIALGIAKVRVEMSKFIASLLGGGGAVLFAVLLTGCSLFQSSEGQSPDPKTSAPSVRTVPSSTDTPMPSPTPTATATSVPTPTSTATATNFPSPTPTPPATHTPTAAPSTITSPTATATPEPAPTPSGTPGPTDTYALAASAIPFFDEYLGEYEEWCRVLTSPPEWADNIESSTYGEVSAHYQKVLDAAPQTDPPDVVADWHHASVISIQLLLDVLGDYPKDALVDLSVFDDEGLTEEYIARLAEHMTPPDIEDLEDIDVFDKRIPSYVRKQMAPAGCVRYDHRARRDIVTLIEVEFPHATSIVAGEVVAGNLDDGLDYFRFDVEKGQMYAIGLISEPPEDWADGYVNEVGRYDAAGKALGYVPSSFAWNETYHDPGEYYFEVSGSPIPYRLKIIAVSDIIDDHGNRADDATDLTLGEPVTGTLEEWFDRDWFRFQAEEGRGYRIDLANLTDLRWTLFDSDQEPLLGSGQSSIWEAPVPGDYYINIWGQEADSAGAYILVINKAAVPDQPAPTAVPVQPAPTQAPQPAATAVPAQPAPTAAPPAQPAPIATPQAQAEPTPTAVRAQPAATAAPAVPKTRLQAVRDRGALVCASRSDLPGFVYLDTLGNIVGFDIDLCRAVAAAVLGDPNAIVIMEIISAARGSVLQSGKVDLLIGMVTWTSSRDAQWGDYPQTMFFDGQGFMVNKNLGISSALELKDATVCVTQGTRTELNLQDFSNQNNLNITPLTFEDTDAVVAAYESEQCDAFTNDLTQLAAVRSAFEDRDDHVILREAISDVPMGPVVPHGDAQWLNIVRTVMAILIHGEAYGITQNSVPSTSTNELIVDILLGIEGSFGQEYLGLSRTVAQDVLKGVGNYGEIYDRNLGPDGIDLPREGGRNALWADAPCRDCPKGGQIYAVPLR